jgi:hypothetical protein
MFTHLLPSKNRLLIGSYSEYAKRHFIKRFAKDYPGQQWAVTQEAILEDLTRLDYAANDLQKGQQVDELKHNDSCWLLKYDFRVALTKQSAKASGNRCIAYLDYKCGLLDILLVYGKDDLPKKKPETKFIEDTVKTHFPDYWKTLS